MGKVFFSQVNHNSQRGKGTLQYPSAVDGQVLRVNYHGSEVGGFPGYVDEAGDVIRPPNYESYVYVGELQQGKIYPANMDLAIDTRTATDRLIHALFDRDLLKVKNAILDGANVNALFAPQSPDPIWFGHMRLRDYDEGSRSDWNKIYEVMAPHARGTITKNGHITENFYAVFGFQNIEASSLAVLVVIKESLGSARINLEQYFAGLGDASDPYHPIRKERKANILAVHARVIERLSEPSTPFENEAMASLSEDNKSYWMKPLAFPDLADLPMPSQQYINAVERMSVASREISEIIDPFITRQGVMRMPEGHRMAMHIAFGDTADAIADIDQLRQRGLLGFRKPRPRGKPFAQS